MILKKIRLPKASIGINLRSDYQTYTIPLKTLDTFGNCQRPVVSLGVSQHNAWNNKSVKIWTELVIEVSENHERKNTLVALRFVSFRCLIIEPISNTSGQWRYWFSCSLQVWIPGIRTPSFKTIICKTVFLPLLKRYSNIALIHSCIPDYTTKLFCKFSFHPQKKFKVEKVNFYPGKPIKFYFYTIVAQLADTSATVLIDKVRTTEKH